MTRDVEHFLLERTSADLDSKVFDPNIWLGNGAVQLQQRKTQQKVLQNTLLLS